MLLLWRLDAACRLLLRVQQLRCNQWLQLITASEVTNCPGDSRGSLLYLPERKRIPIANLTENLMAGHSCTVLNQMPIETCALA